MVEKPFLKHIGKYNNYCRYFQCLLTIVVWPSFSSNFAQFRNLASTQRGQCCVLFSRVISVQPNRWQWFKADCFFFNMISSEWVACLGQQWKAMGRRIAFGACVGPGTLSTREWGQRTCDFSSIHRLSVLSENKFFNFENKRQNENFAPILCAWLSARCQW